MQTRTKHRGVLSLEFALLIPTLMTIFLLLLSILYTVAIKNEIDRGIGKALEDVSSEIYLSSRIIEDSSLSEGLRTFIEPLNDFLGLNIDLKTLLSESALKRRIRAKSYEYIGKKEELFWLKEDIDFDLSYSSNTLIVKSESKIKLPVLNAMLGEITFERYHIQAARGVGTLLGREEEGGQDSKQRLPVTICEYSHSGESKNPVFHTQNCMGRKNEKAENSIHFKIEKNKISEDGSILFKGKTYRHCRFCQRMSRPSTD